MAILFLLIVNSPICDVLIVPLLPVYRQQAPGVTLKKLYPPPLPAREGIPEASRKWSASKSLQSAWK
jgi:hypothetical protein